MGKHLYTLKLKNLYNQISLMLMEAEGDVEEHKMSIKTSLDNMKNYLGGKSYDKQAKDYFAKVSGFTDKLKKSSFDAQGKMPSVGEIEADAVEKISALKATILSATSLIAGAIGFLNIFAKGLEDVKKMTDLTLNADNYQEFSKSVKALQKLASNNSIWSKLTVSSSAKELAMSNSDVIKKGYIMAGVAMIITSVILVALTGSMVNVVGSIEEAIKSLDVKSILSALGKMLGLGVLVIPAILGVCLILVALHGFNNEELASKVASACYPVMKVINMIIAKVIELSQNIARNKVQYVKKMKALKK